MSGEVVEQVERELRCQYGPAFRLEVTTGENLWGPILVRDIVSSPLLGTVGQRGHELRALRFEDLFLLKLAAGRARDMADLPLIAPHTCPEALVARWNQLIEWHGDRRAILGYADALVTQLVRWYGSDPMAIIDGLHTTDSARLALREAFAPAGESS